MKAKALGINTFKQFEVNKISSFKEIDFDA
jgi:hypothetical protein